MRFRGGLAGLLAALALCARAASAAPALLAVQFAPTPTGTEIVLSLAAPAEFHAAVSAAAMGAASPGRIEVTIDAAGVALGATAGRGFGAVASFGVVSAPPGQTRYVFELARPATIHGAHLQPAAQGRPARAIIELESADPIAMTAALGQAVVPTVTPAPEQAGATASAGPQPRVKSSARARAAPPTRAVAASSVPKTVAPRAVLPAPKRVIVIDPGHGGVDPGADSIAGYPEKEITLAEARVLRRVLEDTGRYRVVLTRDRDLYLKLPERVARARTAHGELFISLHADSLGGPLQPASVRGGARGASIYTLSETATDAESERLAQRENRADALGGVTLSDESDDVAGILVDLAVRETVNNGNRFANLLVTSLRDQGVALFPRMPHRSAGFAVLKAPDIPSVLVEMGYLSDIREARGLADPAYRRRIALAITAAVDRYFAVAEASRS